MTTKKQKNQKTEESKNSTIKIYPEPTINALFPTPVLFTKYPGTYTKEQISLFEKCALDTTRNTGNLTSANRYVLEEPGMEDIKDYVQFYINHFMETIEAPKYDVKAYITQSWLNYTKTGEFHHKHEHPNSYLSGVFYVNADPEKDKIYFYKNGYKRISLPTERYNHFNSESWWFSVGTCDMVIFPSYLTHMVEQTVSTETRISIAFNTFLEGYVGDEHSLTGLHLQNQNEKASQRKERRPADKSGPGGSI